MCELHYTFRKKTGWKMGRFKTLICCTALALLSATAVHAGIMNPIPGDPITIDADRGVIDLEIPAEALASRLAAWKRPALRYTTGVFAKYCALVSSASEGAVTRASNL